MCMPNQHADRFSEVSIEAMGSGANLGEPLAQTIRYYGSTQVVILGTADASPVYGQWLKKSKLSA